jgi:DNA-directed RNA polymerase specialized sigma24 family protein
MGFAGWITKTETPRIWSRRDRNRERFSAYFPRLFAYIYGTIGDEEAARELSVASFSDVFSLPDIEESEFSLQLFRIARALARRPDVRARRPHDGLTSREHDVVSLVFDAQLDRAQIGQLLGLRPETVASMLMRGLRKLREAPEGTLPAGLAHGFS